MQRVFDVRRPQKPMSSSSPTKRAGRANRPPRSTSRSRWRRRARASRASISIIASAPSGAISTTAPRRSSAPAATCRSPRHATHDGESLARFTETVRAAARRRDFLVDRHAGPRRPFARMAAPRADTLVTPMNDSFVDFDLIGQVDPETYKVTRPSFYAELIWDARKARAKRTARRSTGWCCATACSISRRATCAACRRR